MAGQDNERPDNSALEQQMKALLNRIEDEPVPAELHRLAEELQSQLRRQSKAKLPKK